MFLMRADPLWGGWALWTGIELLGKCHLGPQPFPLAQEMDLPASKTLRKGRINHRCIGSFMYKSSHGSFQGP